MYRKTSLQARQSLGFPMLLTAWTLAEIIRYSFYFMGLIGKNIPVLTWLRYTMFIVLYPLGITVIQSDNFFSKRILDGLWIAAKLLRFFCVIAGGTSDHVQLLVQYRERAPTFLQNWSKFFVVYLPVDDAFLHSK